MSAPSAPTLTAVAQADPLTGWPEILLTVTNTQGFNVVGTNDASFEDGIGSAVSSDALLSTPTTYALDGTHSLGIQAESASTLAAVLGPYPIDASEVYSVTASFHAIATVEPCKLVLEWFNGSSFISSIASTQVNDSASHWTTYTIVGATPPPLTTACKLSLDINGSPSSPLGAPATPSVTPTGATGVVAYHYQVTDYNIYGESTASATGSTTTGVSTLTSSHYNALAWTAKSGATGYNIYRSQEATCEDIALDYATCLALEDAFSTCADLITYAPTPRYYDTVTTDSYHDIGAGTLAARLPPVIDFTGEQHLVDEVGLFLGATAVWTLASMGVFEIIRQPGDYVLGASPLFPLAIGADNVSTIVDTNAPYGLTALYTAVLSTNAQTTAFSNQARATMGQAPDTVLLYNRLGWAQVEDQQ